MSANHAGVITAKAPEAREENLTRVLKPIHLWALAVGLATTLVGAMALPLAASWGWLWP